MLIPKARTVNTASDTSATTPDVAGHPDTPRPVGPTIAADRRRGPYRTDVLLWVAGAMAIALALRSDYTAQLLGFATLYALAAAGWNLVSGYAGQVSFGHAAFFGIGAYGAAYAGAKIGTSPWVGIGLGLAVALVLALAVGYVCWRLDVRGIYFALVMFAVSELLRIIVSNIRPLGGTTGIYSSVGTDGIVNLSFGDARWFVLIGGVILIAVLLGTRVLARSTLGLQMAAIRNDEVAAEASGIHAMRVKLIALGLSASVTAVAGGLYAQLHLFVQPDTAFGVTTNLRIILIGFLGGVGSLLGPVLGSGAVTIVEAGTLEAFQGVPGADGAAFGLLLVAAVTFLPHGFARLRRRRPTATPAIEPVAEPTGAHLPARTSPSSAAAVTPLADRPAVLEGRGLTKHFGGLTVVDEIDIILREGTIQGLIGPNGAGKTTLLNMLAGAVVRDGGEVCLRGEQISELPVHERAHRGLARTFQVPRGSGDMSVWDAVRVAAAAACGRSGDPDVAAAQALRTVGLAEHAHRLWEDLNGSEKRRFDVARCLAQRPQVLLLDEPMSGLGREELDAMVELIRALPRERPEMTVLIIEHNMKVMMALAEHLTVLGDGRELSSGTAEQIMGDEAVINAYLGRHGT